MIARTFSQDSIHARTVECLSCKDIFASPPSTGPAPLRLTILMVKYSLSQYGGSHG